MKKTVITLLSLLIFLLTIVGALYFYTMHAGKQSLRQLARDGKFCGQAIARQHTPTVPNNLGDATIPDDDDCQDGIDYASNYLGTEFGLSPTGIQWCMGVDEIAQRKLSFGNGIKTMLTNIMYISCGDQLADQPSDSEDE